LYSIGFSIEGKGKKKKKKREIRCAARGKSDVQVVKLRKKELFPMNVPTRSSLGHRAPAKEKKKEREETEGKARRSRCPFTSLSQGQEERIRTRGSNAPSSRVPAG